MADQLKPVETIAGTDLSLHGDEHVRVYHESNGEEGNIWNGVPTLLVTMIGRKSGLKRTIPIIYTQVGDKYVIIASKGGWATHPAWYLNLLENPDVEVQVKADVFKAKARTAISPEREQLWAEAARAWPNYDIYQTRTNREIPVVVLERA